jgi:hypothetical protein
MVLPWEKTRALVVPLVLTADTEVLAVSSGVGAVNITKFLPMLICL